MAKNGQGTRLVLFPGCALQRGAAVVKESAGRLGGTYAALLVASALRPASQCTRVLLQET
eukprot:CAMPEP_0197890440 /NCGR_PEP_ID=MMETSP1439-20131203/26657_1 /TAXON_ID=66791 /ORGANISM="Gonyaulax spinifera, Strain CCMP409" /LENGTH=59 /DNA_ID=CAMNT_0043510475 /DNA_START=91 /DNA_END=266 /DNA_ORIENTATION=-